MNRRAFLSLFGKAAATALPAVATADLLLDPERALWVPGAKTFFFPANEPIIKSFSEIELLRQQSFVGYAQDVASLEYEQLRQRHIDDIVSGARGGKSLLTIDAITREALKVLEDNLKMAMFVNREYDRQFRVAGTNGIGSTVQVRIPRRCSHGE